MKDIEIEISRKNSFVDLPTYTLAVGGENLQGNLIFSFKDEFVNGQARLELTIDGQDSWIPLLKNEETYYCPIKSAITKEGQIEMQLVITENENEEGIPIFKSNVFKLWCESSINAEIEQPSEYPEWIDIANTKLNQMDNFDIDATKTGDTATITITQRDGTEKSVEIVDGEEGPQGETGPAGQDAKINGLNTLNIVAGDNIEIEQEDNTMTISSTGGGGGATYTAGTGIEITQQNVINNTAPNKLISITVDPQTMELDKTAGEINSLIEQGYLILLMGRLMFIEEYDSSRDKLYAYFYSGGYATKFTITGNQVTDYESLDVVYDNHYTHTDNNYTNADKTKLDGLENKIINVNADQQTMQFDKTADEINEYLTNGYIVMALGYQVFRKEYNASTHTIKLAIYFGSFGQVITVVGNQITGVDEYFYVNDNSYVHTDNNFSSYYKEKLDTTAEIVQNNTGLVNGGQVYEALQNAGGGKTFCLGNVADFTQANPLDVSELGIGTFLLYSESANNTLYVNGTNNGVDFTGNVDLTVNYNYMKPYLFYVNLTVDISEIQLTSTDQNVGTISFISYNKNTNNITNYSYLLKMSKSGNVISFSYSKSTNEETLMTTGDAQTVSGKKTFSTLPESSVVPTSDDQLVNKKYVDDNAGGGENYFVNLGYDYFNNLSLATIQKIIDNMAKNSLNVAYLIRSHSGYRDFDIFSASLSDSLSTSITSYILNVWDLNFKDNLAESGLGNNGIPIKKQVYNVTISWSDNVPTVTATSISGSLVSNTIILNGNTKSWTPSTKYSPTSKKYVDELYKSYTGYDATKTQVLKNINGTLTWVDET